MDGEFSPAVLVAHTGLNPLCFCFRKHECFKCDVSSYRKPVDGTQSCGDGERGGVEDKACRFIQDQERDDHLRVQHRTFHVVSFPSPVNIICIEILLGLIPELCFYYDLKISAQ